MRLVQLALILPLLTGPGAAQARPWKGVSPGTSSMADVEKKFGDPTTRTKRGGRTVLAYYGDQTPEGTKQAQFHVDGGGTVQEITIFLATPLDPETIEGTYGKSPKKTFIEDTFQKVWVYTDQGVVVYWAKDGSGAEALSFTPAKAAAGKPDAGKPEGGKGEPAGGKAEPGGGKAEPGGGKPGKES